MRKLFCLLMFCGLLICGQAEAYTINDAIGDRIGDSTFEVYGINVSTSGSILRFDIFTNYPSTNYPVGLWNTLPGDLALSVDGNKSYEFGIALTAHDNLTAGSLYNITSWKYSNDYAVSGYTYNHDQIVRIGAGSLVSSGYVQWTGAGTNPSYDIVVEIPLAALGDIVGGINIHYATATCANDYVEGTAPVPEPATMLLLGSGLVGLVGFRKKFKK